MLIKIKPEPFKINKILLKSQLFQKIKNNLDVF